jgi:uracil-DNA glycosylase
VRGFAGYGPKLIPLPHPSWRSTGWMRRNPWFEADVLPALRKRVRAALAD